MSSDNQTIIPPAPNADTNTSANEALTYISKNAVFIGKVLAHAHITISDDRWQIITTSLGMKSARHKWGKVKSRLAILSGTSPAPNNKKPKMKKEGLELGVPQHGKRKAKAEDDSEDGDDVDDDGSGMIKKVKIEDGRMRDYEGDEVVDLKDGIKKEIKEVESLIKIETSEDEDEDMKHKMEEKDDDGDDEVIVVRRIEKVPKLIRTFDLDSEEMEL